MWLASTSESPSELTSSITNPRWRRKCSAPLAIAAKNGLAMSRMRNPIVYVLPVRRLWARKLGS